MPRRKNLRKKTKPRINRGPKRRNQTTGALINVKHYARITEAVNFTPMVANTDYNYQFSLSLFARAVEVSKNFKFYRAKRVAWTYLPDYNTFQVGAGNVSVPQMSLIMNRTGDSTLWTPAEYDAQGAVPKQFNKKMVVAYNPNIVQSIQYINNSTAPTPFTGNVGARPIYNEWINTGSYNRVVNTPGVPPALGIIAEANNLLLYQGHSIYWEVSNTAPAEPNLGTVICEVEWEFKDPLFVAESSSSLVAETKVE